MIRFAAPLVVFALMVALLGYGLRLDPKIVPSPLIDKPAPEFSLPLLDEPARRVSLADLRGRHVVIAFFPKAFTGG